MVLTILRIDYYHYLYWEIKLTMTEKVRENDIDP